MGSVKADRHLYLTADRSEVVEAGDPRAAFLLAAEGHDVDAAEAERLGLSGKKPAKAEPVEEAAPAEAKEQAAPANKARKAAANK